MTENIKSTYKENLLNTDSSTCEVVPDVNDSLSFFNQIYNENIVGIVRLSVPDFRLVHANRLFFSIIQKNDYDILNLPIQRFIHNQELLITSLDQIMEKKQSISLKELVFHYGNLQESYWDCMISPVLRNGRVSFIMLMFISANDRVRARQKVENQARFLLHQKNLLYNIFESLELPMYRLSFPSLLIVETNKRGEDRLRINNIPLGSCITDLIPSISQEMIQNANNHLIHQKKPYQIDHLGFVEEDKSRWFNAILQPMMDANGEIYEILVVAVDITHEIEEKASIEKVMRLKNDFFSFMSHEFKTPLTVINAAVQAMEMVCKNELTQKSKGFLLKIRQNSLRLLRLINNLLEITRIDSGFVKIHKTNVDVIFITKAIIESVQIYAQQRKIHLFLETQRQSHIIGMDEEKYEQILFNLLSNAIKFTPTGKSIRVRLVINKDSLQLEVKDEGVGIPPEKLDIIFERFGQVDSLLTRKSEGSGIGLSLVKMLVNALEGSISLKSIPGKGSTFTVSLPCPLIEDPQKTTNPNESREQIVQMSTLEFSDIYVNQS